MPGNNNKNNQKDKKSTGMIQAFLQQHTQEDEATLPNHLLSADSPVKKKRDADQQYSALLDNMLVELRVLYMVNQAKLKFQEDEAFYLAMFKLEEKATEFRNMLVQIAEEHNMAKLNEEQWIYLQRYMDNFNVLLNAVVEKAIKYKADISTIRDEITSMKSTLVNMRENYSDVFRQCFTKPTGFVPLSPMQITSKPQALYWVVEMDEFKFRRLGEAIADRILQEDVSLLEVKTLIKDEARRFVHGELEMNLAAVPDRQRVAKDIMQSPEMDNFVRSVADQVQQHVEREQTYPALLGIAEAYAKRQEEIAQREAVLAELEKKVEKLDRYKEVLESMVDVNLQILDEKKCDPAVAEEFIKSSREMVQEIVRECEIPAGTIHFDDSDPFSEIEEPGPSGPRMR